MEQLILDMGLERVPSLDNFWAGANAPVVAHLRQWLQRWNVQAGWAPIYLWGDRGCGKTHLLRAAEAWLRERGVLLLWINPVHPSWASVLDCPQAWTGVVLDDVHAYDAARQQVAFQVLVHAQSMALPVLAAGAWPPADLPLREDVRTRLGGGHVWALRPLDEDTCKAVLHEQAHVRGIEIDDGVMDFLLRRFSRDLSSMMALLDRVDRYALQTGRCVTIPLVRSMMEQAQA
ncbi:HdaA/DnaA family protein [Candidatus Symbiobacter mobilis]|uniref:DnaA-like protein n=1 Tax=Candidatus Symbiobacter mobilis CR TaxID=946483 RepID=U5N6G4_9BURK|nr:DnaA/Hda family protein [Candidatus Symbiobacter mobilis]AGX87126.1 DnaA-like protein [Candidatus Symbiobacter mobilis CR]